MIYLLLSQVVGQVSNHDLVLGGDTISWRSTLTSLTGGAVLFLLVHVVSIVLVGDVRQW